MTISLKPAKRDALKEILRSKPVVYKQIRFFFKEQGENIELSFVFPKRIVKKTTYRNQLKRKLKGMINTHKKDIKPFTGIMFYNNIDEYIENTIDVLKKTELLK